jgi:hypothetical protein
MSNVINVKLKRKPTVFVNQSGLVARKLSDLSDIDISNKEDGSLLIYDEENNLYKTSLTGFVNKKKNENFTQSHIEKVILQIVPYYKSEVFGRDVVNFE